MIKTKILNKYLINIFTLIVILFALLLPNVGHTFVSLGTGKDQIVYTYGRWAGTTGFIRTPLNNDPGVMVKLQGDDAKKRSRKI